MGVERIVGTPSSLRRRLTFLMLTLFAVSGTFTFFQFLYFFKGLDETSRQQTHVGRAAQVAARIRVALEQRASREVLMEIGAEDARHNPDDALYILDDSGTILFSLSPHTGYQENRVPLEPIRRFLQAPLDSFPIYNTDPQDGRLGVFSAAELQYQGKPIYIYEVIGGSGAFDKARGVARENWHAIQGISIFILSSAITVAIAIFMISLIAGRFEQITAVVKQYRDGDFSARVPKSPPDELGQLSQTINSMAEQIESNIAALQHRDNLRRELIANVSHDLRSPASHIRIATEDLRRGDEKYSIELLQNSVEVLEQMLEELFLLSNLEAQQQLPKPVPFPLEELFEDLQVRYFAEAAKKHLTLTFRSEQDLPLVSADPAMIGRVLGNLIGNAIRYTPNAGSISVSALRSEELIEVKVSDTGVGISPSELPHLFDRYYKGEESRPSTPGSTGLGLAISKRIVELHGSDIFVQSAPNSGTDVWFKLRTA